MLSAPLTLSMNGLFVTPKFTTSTQESTDRAGYAWIPSPAVRTGLRASSWRIQTPFCLCFEGVRCENEDCSSHGVVRVPVIASNVFFFLFLSEFEKK